MQDVWMRGISRKQLNSRKALTPTIPFVRPRIIINISKEQWRWISRRFWLFRRVPVKYFHYHIPIVCSTRLTREVTRLPGPIYIYFIFLYYFVLNTSRFRPNILRAHIACICHRILFKYSYCVIFFYQ